LKKKRIVSTIFLIILLSFSLLLAITHINYVITYEDHYSYMTKANAVIVSIICSFIAVASFSMIIYSVISIIKKSKSKGNDKIVQNRSTNTS